VNDLLFPDDEPDIVRMGGKAYALAKLGSQFPIPDWFVVTPDAVHDGNLKEGTKDVLQDSLKNLGNGLFAVRSSAVDEDGSESSFAGQFESFLNIPANDVEQKISEVWKSAFMDSVLSYRKQRGLQTTPSAPAVLIQKMVKAESAGVAFSLFFASNLSKLSDLDLFDIEDEDF
jgi:pyruvate,water dikinase